MSSIGELARTGDLEFGDGYRTKRSEHADSGFRILRAGDVRDGRIHPHGPDCVANAYAHAIGRKSARLGDVVITTKGTVGRTAIVTSLAEAVVYSPQVCFFRCQPGGRLDSGYLRHWLQSPAFIDQSGYLKDGTDMAPYISLRDLASVRIPLPPLPTQRAIAEVLGALDDKIAANRETATAADLLVREMFARHSDADQEISVGDLARNVRDGTKPPFEGCEYLGLEHVPRRLMWQSGTGEADGLASGKFKFVRDDVLFGKLRPYFHKVVIADRPGICSTDILVVRPKNPSLNGFVWAALNSDGVVARVSAMSEGTRMPRTNWTDLAYCVVSWPGEARAAQLSERVVGVRDRVSAALAESRVFAALRDTLLPPLMSGRLTVREAETALEEAL